MPERPKARATAPGPERLHRTADVPQANKLGNVRQLAAAARDGVRYDFALAAVERGFVAEHEQNVDPAALVDIDRSECRAGSVIAGAPVVRAGLRRTPEAVAAVAGVASPVVVVVAEIGLDDVSLAAGGKVGVFLTLQVGSGAQGNTQWPQFRQYLEIEIQP